MAVTISGSGTIDVGGTSTSQGTVRLYEDTDNGTNYVELVAPASVASNVTLTMPTTTGTVATVAGSDTQVIFNDGGSAYGGDSGLTYNKTTDTLTTSVVVHGAGSASAPSITATGDTNTGVYFPGADSVAITTGGTAAVTVDSGQRTKFPTTIGVGNATPSTSGSGITFPATQSASSDANTLDDYEEGTWTAVVRGGATAGTYEISAQQSNYTKVGRVVHLQSRIVLAGSITGGGVGDLWVTGLPFTKIADSAPAGTVFFSNVDYQGVSLSAVFQSLSASAILSFAGSTDNAALLLADISGVAASDVIGFSITYFV